MTYQQYVAANPIVLETDKCPPSTTTDTDDDRPRGDEPNNDNAITGTSS